MKIYRTTTLKQDSVYNNIRASFLDPREDGGTEPLDLTGATVDFVMRKPDGSAPKIDRSATILAPATAGNVAYGWQTADLDTPGTYYAEWRITDSLGREYTLPADGYEVVEVLPDLG